MARPHRLLFVCTANICRSPMAEGLARAYARRRDWSVETRSGGIMGIVGSPAEPMAVRVMAEIGIDISTHQSGALDEPVVEWADWILVMEQGHATEIRARHPSADARTLMLGTFGGLYEVRDPMGGWRWRFRSCRDEIQRCVEGFMDHLPPAPQER